MSTMIACLLLALGATRAAAQPIGASALAHAIDGLGVNARVLLIGAHPDDEDTNLIAWLSRGRHVTTGYLSLTRGDGGQNVIGNELGEALGVVRTEELLAARRVDGALQFFTRAYDFGFSKDTADANAHWPRRELLGDVVRIVRDFRPHVIIGVFSGTPRDGHGQHQISGILAREAYDLAPDTDRFPVATFGPAWTPSKFYRAARGNAQGGTVGMDVGEYSPILGESFGEIAGRSRSQHKSQAFGALERKGPLMNYLRREATRVNEATAAESEASLFDGIDTSWVRMRAVAGAAQGALDSLSVAFAAVRSAYDPWAPNRVIPALARLSGLLGRVCPPMGPSPCEERALATQSPALADLHVSVAEAQRRVWLALRLASGVTIEATAPREVMAVGTRVPVTVTIYNRGTDTVRISNGVAFGGEEAISTTRVILPGGVLRDSLSIPMTVVTQPWWMAGGRDAAMFSTPASVVAENQRYVPPAVHHLAAVGPTASALVAYDTPVVFRFADDVRGEIQREVAGVPAVSVTLDDRVEYVRANTTVERSVDVRVRSADVNPRDVQVSLVLPQGLLADSAARTVTLRGYDAQQTVSFRVRGRLAAGEHRIVARATSGGETYEHGYELVDYDHIRRQRIYSPSVARLSAVDVAVPPALRVGYIAGVSDNVAPALAQLGIPVTTIPAADVASTDLSRFTTIVVGPRAYDAHPALVPANQRLIDFARRGGTLVVQYGQYEMMQPGIMPYPVTINRPHDRVTHQTAPVTLLDAGARVLTTPNRITLRDFEGWVQERSLYMPRTFDERYRAVLAMNDPGEAPNRGAILVAPLGRGTYVYTTLALFRQLPAGVPGAARLMVNLLSAGLNSPTR